MCDLIAIGALEHQENSAYGLALAVAREGAVARSRAKSDLSNVAYEYWGTKHRTAQRNLFNVAGSLVQAFEANVPGLLRLLDVGTSRVLVALGHSLKHVGHGQAHFA